MLNRIRMYLTVFFVIVLVFDMHKVRQTKTIVHPTLVLSEELHCVGCWLIGGRGFT